MKILMALMGLEIGGAETHVVELSKALKNKGHEIVVASNGGVYQKELEEYGIRHINVPLHSKKPWLCFKSYRKLSKLLNSEKFDIVHAHARIPAFLCGLLAKKHSFRFVTTAHWVFKITPLWKRLANWGEKTIAVSDDIKDYLIENYGIWSDNISTTINGIDTNKFSKSTDWSDIKKEFSLQDNKYRILYVSRIDEDRSAVAYMVAEAMLEILKIRPNAELIIVGGGNDYDRLKKHVDTINEKIGHGAIIMTGGRVDINKFVASADAFVGVSRSALEAMATGIPVVIAGNEGYIGIFDESKFKISYETNYCCRGCVPSSTKLITEDLKNIVTMSEDQLEKIRQYNQSVISNYYSAERMALDYDKMYMSLTPLQHYSHGDIIINGYYGYKNTGDDALLQAMIENIKAIHSDAKITVLSASPKETSSRYGVNSINRYNIFKIIKELKESKLYISGGGSLLQDITSTKSLLYYTAMIKLAKRHNNKVVIYANGFGPINKQKNLERVSKALASADYISMREPESASSLKNLIPNLTITTSADPAFSLLPCNSQWTKKLLAKYKLDDKKKYYAVSLRDWRYNDKTTVDSIAKFCEEMHKRHNFIPVFITMQSTKDEAITQNVIQKLSFDSIIIKKATAKELISIMSQMTFSIGMRLHFLIFSANAGAPAIGLSYDPKINSLLEYIGCDSPIDSSKIDINVLLNKAEEVIKNREEISSSLKSKTNDMKARNINDAKQTIILLKQ